MHQRNVVRLGVVGCGWLTEHVHLPALANLPSATVVALADPDPGRRALVRRLAPGASQHARLEDLLASAAVDALIIAAPTGWHADLACLAFGSGKHVYLEKPVASTLPEARRVLAAWRAAGTIGMVGYNFRRNPILLAAQRRVHEGQLGPLRAIQGSFHVSTGAVSGWRSDPAAGGGVLLDLLSHHIDLIAALTGDRIASVACRLGARHAAEDEAVATLVTASGLTAQLTASYASGVHVNRLDVVGEHGHLVVDLLDARPREVARRPGAGARVHRLRHALGALHPANLLRSPGHEPSFRAALAAFTEAVRTATPALPDVATGVTTMAVVEAARRSAARAGAPESVPESG